MRSDIAHPARYPAVDATLLIEVAEHEHPGDLVYVELVGPVPVGAPVTRPTEAGVRFGLGHGVHRGDHPTRAVRGPVLSWETGFHPRRWARQNDSAQRLWFVGGGFPPSRHDREYRAILAAGWRPVTVLRASGSVAILMTRR